MGNAVVYYSWTGNTEAAALEISDALGAAAVKLCEEKQRGSFIGSACSAIAGRRSKLRPFSLPGRTDGIFLGTPVWASHCTPAVNAFIEKTDFTGKKVFLFFTLASREAPEKLVSSMKCRIEKNGGSGCGCVSFQTKKGGDTGCRDLRGRARQWAESLSL